MEVLLRLIGFIKKIPPSFWTFSGTLLVVVLTQRLTISSQKQISDYQKRQQAYSKLQGLRFPTKQLYVSRFEARIFSDFYEAKWKLAGTPADSFDFQESVRWMHQSEDLVSKVVENHKDLYACLGDIQVVFKPSPELNRLTEAVYNFKGITIKEPPPGADALALKTWKVKAVEQLQEFVDNIYGEPIEKLATYLRKELTD